ncbi:MAG: Nif11-like leader peptide family RiPP precursor [Clostridium sp.]|nr:Nif11-like leader peptide family RiPP precursor [Clostridium sp.]
MEPSKELIEKAKAAAAPQELLELAKAEGIELTEAEAKEGFARLRSGELSEEELENVSGGSEFWASINRKPKIPFIH